MHKRIQTKKVKFIFLLAVLPVISAASTEYVCSPESIPFTAPTNQFINNNNGTVTDKITGLMWKKCSEGQTWNRTTDNCDSSASGYTWQDALVQAKTLNNNGGFAGQVDWRVPSIKELISIVERQCAYPAINLEVFPDTPTYENFWSSSSVTSNSSSAWKVYFNSGGHERAYKHYTYSVRLVRGE